MTASSPSGERTFPPELAALQDLIGSELRQVEQFMRSVEVTSLEPLREAYLRILDRGGKRLRPALSLLSASLLRTPGEPVPDTVIALGGAVEMLHTSTLVHDDVIDQAPTRRGAPALNATWSPGASVVAGDYMFAQAAHFCALTGHAGVNQVFSQALEILVMGEIQQLKSRHDLDATVSQYFERIAWKTASIFRVATENAGLLAGFSDRRVRALRQFGHFFGIAFQIVDDILDYIGDEESLGKPAGFDLLSGNCTLPFHFFLEGRRDSAKELENLKEANSYRFRKPDVWAAAVRDFVAVVLESDAIERSFAAARRNVRRAQNCLLAFPPSPYRQAQHDLGSLVLSRSI